MPSFDMVSEVDFHEVTNAIDQANRELKTRFDFRGVNARFELFDGLVKLSAEGGGGSNARQVGGSCRVVKGIPAWNIPPPV